MNQGNHGVMRDTALEGFWMRREPVPPEEYGDIRLSVQVGPMYWCDYDREKDVYVNAEIALLRGGSIVRPDAVGLPVNVCALFESNESPVAGRVPWAMVNQIREMLKSIERMRDGQSPFR